MSEAREPWNKAILFSDIRWDWGGDAGLVRKVLSLCVNINTKRNGLQKPKHVTAVYVRYRASRSFLHTCEPYPNLDGLSASRRRHKHNLCMHDVFGNATSLSHVWKDLLISPDRDDQVFVFYPLHNTWPSPYPHAPRIGHMLQHDRQYVQQRRIMSLEKFVSCKYSVVWAG